MLKALAILALLANACFAFRTPMRTPSILTRLPVAPLEIAGQLDAKKSWSVKFILNGVEKISEVPETTSFLEAAEGLFDDAPYSCRNGICTTCAARVIKGNSNVLLAVHGVTKAIIDQGYICSCQAFAKGPDIIVQLGAYDEVYELQYGQYEKSYEKTALTGKWDEKLKKYV
jgi:ferredoxin